MTGRERFLAAAARQPVDQRPVGCWIHFGSALWAPDISAAAHLRFAEEYGFDYIKVMNDYRFPTEGGVEEARQPEDLRSVGGPELEYDNRARQVEVLRRVREAAPERAVLDTVFSPFQTVVRTLGRSAVPLLQGRPDLAHEVIGAVADRLVEHVEATADQVDALFFSVNGSSRDEHGFGLSPEEFQDWVAPYDRRVLEAAADRVRVAHVHGYDLDPALTEDYPFEVLSWSHNQTPPPVEDLAETGPVPMGGLDEVASLYWPPSAARENVLDTRRRSGDALIVGPGCTVHSDTPPSVIRALVASAREPLS